MWNVVPISHVIHMWVFSCGFFVRGISQNFDDIEGSTMIVFSFGNLMKTSTIGDSRTVQKCEEMNLKLKEEKYKFNVEEVFYCGHNFTTWWIENKSNSAYASSLFKEICWKVVRNCQLLGETFIKISQHYCSNPETTKKGRGISPVTWTSEGLKRSWPANQVQFLRFLILQNQ